MRESDRRTDPPAGERIVLEALLEEAGRFDLAPAADLDEKVRRIIYGNAGKEKTFLIRRFFRSLFVKYAVAFCLLAAFSLFFGRMMSLRDRERKEEIYAGIIRRITAINEKKDVEEALGFFSEEFFRQNDRRQLKKNVEELFENYAPIRYKPEKVEVVLDGDSVLIKNRIRYSAAAANGHFRSISMEGLERIYLKKDRDEWKIVAWVLEK